MNLVLNLLSNQLKCTETIIHNQRVRRVTYGHLPGYEEAKDHEDNLKYAEQLVEAIEILTHHEKLSQKENLRATTKPVKKRD